MKLLKILKGLLFESLIVERQPSPYDLAKVEVDNNLIIHFDERRKSRKYIYKGINITKVYHPAYINKLDPIELLEFLNLLVTAEADKKRVRKATTLRLKKEKTEGRKKRNKIRREKLYKELGFVMTPEILAAYEKYDR